MCLTIASVSTGFNLVSRAKHRTLAPARSPGQHHNRQIQAQMARMHIYTQYPLDVFAGGRARARSDNNAPLIFARYRGDARAKE